MGHKVIYLLTFLMVCVGQSQKRYVTRTIAFYNVENLFDTANDSLTFDDDWTPEGKYRWTMGRYQKKIDHISKVLSEIGAEVTQTSPDIIGLCEVENKQVVTDLVAHPNLRNKNYGIVHFDSPDERGIDVALLYKKAVFLPTSFASHRLLLYKEAEERDYTRDQLVVGGILDGEQMYFIVNHWPSRSGGETRSRPHRIAAAKLNRRILDSLSKHDDEANIISMGDLNDDPVDHGLKHVLKTDGKRQAQTQLFNPMEQLYRKGAGTLAYRDQWNLFDQFFFTPSLLQVRKDRYRFWKAGIFRPPYLVVPNGKYKGYPFRTFASGNYTGGYSDHFPVYMYLIKEVRH